MDVREKLLKQSEHMKGQEREEYIDFLRRLFDSSDNFDGKQPESKELQKNLVSAIMKLDYQKQISLWEELTERGLITG